MVVPFRKILWIKSVSLDDGEFAYPGRPGQRFALHCTPEDADSLGDPEVGDLVVLLQRDQATHLARVTGEGVEPRPRRGMRKGTRDERFSMQRECEHMIVRPFEEAPFADEAFGADPGAGGGEMFQIEGLPVVAAASQPMWMIQRRLLNALEGPSIRTLFVTRHERVKPNPPEMKVQDFLHKEAED